MYAGPLVFPKSVLKDKKVPSGAFYTLHNTDDPRRRQSSHPLLAPLTGASLFMSLSAYNTSGIGMLSTVFSVITGTVGLWGLWIVSQVILWSVAISDSGLARSSSLALASAQNLGQTNGPLPSYLVTNLLRRKLRKARRRNSLKYAFFNYSSDTYLVHWRMAIKLMFGMVIHVYEEYTICHDPYLPSS
jgi:hypothetical protein